MCFSACLHTTLRRAAHVRVTQSAAVRRGRARRAEALRLSVVAAAQRSAGARAKEQSKRTAEGLPVMSFQRLLSHLPTLTQTHLRFGDRHALEVHQLGVPIALQQCVFDLLGVKP